MPNFLPVSPILPRFNQQFYALSQNAHDQTLPPFKDRFTNDIEVPRPAIHHDHFSISLGMELMNDFTSFEETYRSVLHAFHLDNLALFDNLLARPYYYTDIKHAKLSKDLCSLDLSLHYVHPPHGFVFVEQNTTHRYHC